jgi:hypothetical protein
MPVAVAVSVFGSGCFIVWSFVLEPSLRTSMMIERPASILALKRRRITMLGPEVVLFAAGVDSTKTACAAAGRDVEPRISIAKKRYPSRVAARSRSSIDWKFLCNKLLSGTARRSLITDISNPQMFGVAAYCKDNFLEIPHTKVCVTQSLVQCACQRRIACQATVTD